jgi:hypothetical protein
VRTVASILLILSAYSAYGAERIFDSIEFTGLTYLNKNKIAIMCGIKANQSKKLTADVDIIKGCLSKEPLVLSFKLIDKKNVLSINVKEREIRHIAAVKRGAKTALYEIDGDYIPFSSELHRQDLPLIICAESDMEKSRFGRRMIEVFGLLDRFRSDKLWAELETVELLRDGFLEVKLKNRPTLFTVEAEERAVQRLKAAAGWCDANGKYPVRLMIRNEFTVIH